MSTHEALVVPIKLEKHSNADSLSIVKIGGWQCVVKTVDWQNIDKGIYIEPDTLVPLDREEFKFLDSGKGRTHERIKVKKLRGEYSQGLLVYAPLNAKIGEDFWDRLSLERYEPPEVGISRPGGSVKSGEEAKAPKGHWPVYDVENYNKYGHLFQEGEEVWITEKIHGCLTSNGKVRMLDGSFKKISKININDIVLGYQDGQIIPSKVTQVFKNGKGNKWLRIKSSRTGLNRGNSFNQLVCTPEHKFYDPIEKEYKEAKSLKVGDKIFSKRNDLNLSPIQEQILLGIMLGDASLHMTDNSASVRFSHKLDHIEYSNWIIRGLGGIASLKDQQLSGYGTVMQRAATQYSLAIKNKFESFIQNNRKTVPNWVANELMPVSMAFWYMDDGSLLHHENQEDRANFAVCAFTQEECQILQNGLRKFNIDSEYYCDKNNYSRIRLNADNADKFFLLISPYIPPAMQYKLPERYRGHSGWLPETNKLYKVLVVEQKILDIEDVSNLIESDKYDIETETHNYFAHDILVHNSNYRVVWQNNRLHVGSRNKWKKPLNPTLAMPDNTWTRLYNKFTLLKRKFSRRKNWEESTWWKVIENNKWIKEFCQMHEGIAIYGELHGHVQDLKYGFGQFEYAFRVFDLWDGTKFLDYDEAFKILDEKYWCPILYKGPYIEKDIKSFAELDSELAREKGIQQISEGIVIRPAKSRFEQKLNGRLVLKLVSNRYLER